MFIDIFSQNEGFLRRRKHCCDFLRVICQDDFATPSLIVSASRRVLTDSTIVTMPCFLPVSMTLLRKNPPFLLIMFFAPILSVYPNRLLTEATT